MVRGTTAQFKFNLPYQLKDIEGAEITFWQKGDSFSDAHSVIMTKDLRYCSGNPADKVIYVTLTQNDTLSFSEKKHGYVQFRGIAADGSVFASKQESFIVYPLVNGGIIEGGTPPPDDDGDGWEIINGGSVGSLMGD